MLEKIDFMMRFWDLKARYEAADVPLTPVERVELFSLIGLMATDDPLPPAGPPPLSESAAPGQITANGGFLGVEVRMVCARGVVVACASPLPAGQSTVVRLLDDATGVEYAVPCVVEWGFAGSPSSMALRVDGAPARVTFTDPEGPAWGSSIGWVIEPSAAAG